MKVDVYQPRVYRSCCLKGDWISFNASIGESDLFIKAKSDLKDHAFKILQKLRTDIESYIRVDNNFAVSLSPISISTQASDIIRKMAFESSKLGVGPMASVAGAISEGVAKYLYDYSDEIIVENGGDIFMINKEKVDIAIYAGDSKLSMKLKLEIIPFPSGVSVCTSSGSVGHSLSFGNADAVTVIATSGIFADAAATAIGNIVESKNDIDKAFDFARKFQEIIGLVIIVNDNVAILGDVMRLCEL